MAQMPTLYIVATPIGNLEDITLRALRTLRDVDLIAAEDTRVTRKLLARHGISTKLTPFHDHSRRSKLDAIVATLADKDVALVTDAGTPAISDPGQELVRAAAAAGIPVVTVPGPSALPAAVALSGLPAERVTYVGFLPRKRADRKRLLQSLASVPGVLVCFEAPHRLAAALADILETLGDRPIAACREDDKAPRRGLPRLNLRGHRALRRAQRRVHPSHCRGRERRSRSPSLRRRGPRAGNQPPRRRPPLPGRRDRDSRGNRAVQATKRTACGSAPATPQGSPERDRRPFILRDRLI